MNWLDVSILVIIGLATFSGLRTGLIKATFTLAGVIIGIFLAGRLYVSFAEQLTFIPQDNIARIVAFIIILGVVMVVAGVLASVLKWIASLVMLGWVNRLGGAIVGLIFGAFFCGALLSIWVKFLGISTPISESEMALLLLDRLPLALALLPEEFGAIRSFLR
ncbi:MAG: CvpA family protein [Dehalococcoidales bacterium]